jgi:hypothetical protein
MADGSAGTVLLAVAFEGRFSPVGVTAAAQAASDRGIPGGGEPSVEDGTNENRLGLGAVPGGAGVVDPCPEPAVVLPFVITAVAREVAEDVPAREAQFMGDSRVPSGVDALGGMVSDPAWRSKPSWYLVTREDMIPPPLQRTMAERAGASTTEVSASHAI